MWGRGKEVTSIWSKLVPLWRRFAGPGRDNEVFVGAEKRAFVGSEPTQVLKDLAGSETRGKVRPERQR